MASFLCGDQIGEWHLVILAIDTSSSTLSVAVFEGRVLAETSWLAGRNHSKALIREIHRSLGLASLDRTRLGAIALASGPGSYSGLRVGASVAIGLALALSLEIVHVPTLEIIAYGAPSDGRPVRAAIEIGRGRYASARFRCEGDRTTQETDLASDNLADLLALATSEHAALAVDLPPDVRRGLRENGGEVPLFSVAGNFRRAGYLAEIAEQRMLNGRGAGETGAQLIYLPG